MKKTYAILLSLVLVVAAVFALSVSASADAPLATSVTVTHQSGSVTLDGTTTEFVGSAATGTTGKITFDAAKAELTLENVTGVKKITTSDVATIIVKGENTLKDETADNIIRHDSSDNTSLLTIKGDGVLNVIGKQYTIVSTASLEVTGNVILNAETLLKDSTGWSEAIHINNAGLDLIFSGNAVVTAKSHCTAAIRNAAAGSIVIKDNAKVNAVMDDVSWDTARAIDAKNFKMTGGELNVDMFGARVPGVANFYGVHVEGGKMEVLGGKLNVSVGSAYVGTTGLVAINLVNASPVVFEKADVNLTVEYARSHSDSPAVIHLSGVSGMKVTDCNIKIDAEKSTSMISPLNVGDTAETAVFDLDFTRTKIEGIAAYMVSSTDTDKEKTPYVSAINVDFDKSNTADVRVNTAVVNDVCKAKTDASFLSGADFASKVALITGSPITKVVTVSITPPIGADFTLSARKRTLTAEEAAKLGVSQDSIVYDPHTASVTINNMNGDVNRLYANGPVTYVVKGENSITMLPNSADAAFGAGDKMIVTGDGSLTVSGGNCAVMCPGEMIFEGYVKLKVISHSTNAIHISCTSDPGPCSLVVRGNAQLDVLATSRGIHNPGAKPSVLIQDDAKVSIAPLGSTMTQGIYLLADIDDGTGSQDAVVEVSGNASLKIDKAASVGILYQYTAKDDGENKKAIDEKTVINTILNISGNAKVDVAAREQGVLFNVGTTGICTATLNITDSATAKFSSIDGTNKSAKGAAVQMTSSKNSVTMDTTGVVEMFANVGGWRGAFYMTGVDYDVVIRDTILNVSNISTSVASSNPEVTNAINFSCTGAGNFVLAGKAVVTAYAEKNGEGATNCAHGLFLHPNHTLTVQDDAVFNTTATGDSKANTGAGIHLKESFLLVKDNGKMNILAKGTAVAGITFEGVSGLTVEGNGKVSITAEGEDVVGVRSYNRNARGTIDVKEGTGYIEMIGDPAVSTKNRKITINSAIMKTGDTKKDAEVVEKITGKEGYVLLAAKNPPTSDLSITAFVIVGLIAVASTAAVILRKKYND